MSSTCDGCHKAFDLLGTIPYQCPFEDCVKTQCLECWHQEAADHLPRGQDHKTTKSSHDPCYCSYHQQIINQDELVIMYDRLPIDWMDSESAKNLIYVSFGMSEWNSHHQGIEFEVESGQRIDTKFVYRLLMDNIKKWDKNFGDAPIGSIVDGKEIPMPEQFDILISDDVNNKKRKTLVIRDKGIKVSDQYHVNGSYFGQFSQNGRLYIEARHKFVGA